MDSADHADRDTPREKDGDMDRDKAPTQPPETSDPSDTHLLMADRPVRGLRRIGDSHTQRQSTDARDDRGEGAPFEAPSEIDRGLYGAVRATNTAFIEPCDARGRDRGVEAPRPPSPGTPSGGGRGTETRDLSAGVPGDPPDARSDQNPEPGGVKGGSRLRGQTDLAHLVYWLYLTIVVYALVGVALLVWAVIAL